MNPDFCKPADYVEPRDDGGPAFPVQDASKWQGHGMSLRDLFAAQALAMMVSDKFRDKVDDAFPNVSTREAVARYAYAVADAMLTERVK